MDERVRFVARLLEGEQMASLCREFGISRARGVEILVVSSGSIEAGRRQFGLTGGSLKLEEKQASAAVGQIALAHAYKNALAARDIAVAQILLAPGDLADTHQGVGVGPLTRPAP